MNEDIFNIQIRKFLKTVGVTTQREIEKAVRAALADGRLAGDETLRAQARVTVGGIDLTVDIDGTIALK